ncbi:MAG: SDR family NAD(P)-dependent oxidoreductase [Acetobacteraceae bacterium]|nr:SDR family NAD(P)-dependent oxidoreductase [Acetobacteraceae bacterium]
MRYDNVLITGASSGIGRALALACARPGAVLHLSGRHEARLRAVCAEARTNGAMARPRVLDVADRDAMAEWVGNAGRLDLVVANAGVSEGTRGGHVEPADQVATVLATNVSGVVNTVLPALALMREQAPGTDRVRGRIAVVASIAAFVTSPSAPSYCASKAAADTWTCATAPLAARQGIVMTSVCPGFVRTAMTANNRFPMPGILEPDHAAAIILRAVTAGRRRVVFPRWMGLLTRGAGLLPPRILGVTVGRAEKAAAD